MSLKSGSLRIACLLVALGVAGTAHAQQYFTITSGGGQGQIGDGLPVPAQDQISPNGGKCFGMSVTILKGCGANAASGPIGTYTNFPDMLLVKPNADPAKRLIKQTPVAAAGTVPAHMRMKVPPGVFRVIPTKIASVGVAANNPRVMFVQTKLSFSGPGKPATDAMGRKWGGTMSFKAGQRAAKTASFPGAPAGSKVTYKSATNKRFGGPSQTRVVNLGVIGVWADLQDAQPPCKHPQLGGPGAQATCFANKLPAYPGTHAAAGGTIVAGMGLSTNTPGSPKANPMQVAINANTAGSVISDAPLKVHLAVSNTVTDPTPGFTNMATSVGFPWTTGAITLSQPNALGAPEKFHITGMDARTANGAGTISLVASSLSDRTTSGPNANRSWATYTLPEPGAVLGAGAALAVLGVLHALVRRRPR